MPAGNGQTGFLAQRCADLDISSSSTIAIVEGSPPVICFLKLVNADSPTQRPAAARSTRTLKLPPYHMSEKFGDAVLEAMRARHQALATV
ncbi:hypothetical protein C8R46DRAFT_1220321 [Mycena filopes]|nr:hypothetical protein C8R46DRAFT_1220321 [Mycena filopes]